MPRESIDDALRRAMDAYAEQLRAYRRSGGFDVETGRSSASRPNIIMPNENPGFITRYPSQYGPWVVDRPTEDLTTMRFAMDLIDPLPMGRGISPHRWADIDTDTPRGKPPLADAVRYEEIDDPTLKELLLEHITPTLSQWHNENMLPFMKSFHDGFVIEKINRVYNNPPKQYNLVVVYNKLNHSKVVGINRDGKILL